MEGFKIFDEFLKSHGIVGTLLLLFVLDKLKIYDKFIKYIKSRNGKEDHPHRRGDDNEEIIHFHRRDKDDFLELKKKFEDFMVREAQEDIMFAEIKLKQSHLDEKFDDLRSMVEKLMENQSAGFALISKMKDRMIDKKG